MTQTSVKAFMLEDVTALEETKEIKFPQFGDTPVVIKALGADEFNNLSKAATRKVKQGATYTQEVDQRKFNDLMVGAAVVTPDLHDNDLQTHYGTIGDAAGTLRKMLKAGQYADLLNDIQKLSGFEEEKMDDLVDEVKN